jgi:hypothetical protein
MKPNHPILSGLVKLHADLGGRILANRKEATKLTSDMKHIEAVIRMFEPGYDVRRIAVRRRNRKNPWFKRGTLFRAALDVLRRADGPLTTREIAVAMLRAKGVSQPGLKQLRDLYGGIQSSMRNYEGKSVERVGEGMPRRWRLI